MVDSHESVAAMDRLYHNLLGGAGTILTVMPLPRQYAFLPEVLLRPDAEAIFLDWRFVGECIQDSLDKELAEHGTERRQ